ALKRVVHVRVLAHPDVDHGVARRLLRDVRAWALGTRRKRSGVDDDRLDAVACPELGQAELALQGILAPAPSAEADVRGQGRGIMDAPRATEDQLDARND